MFIKSCFTLCLAILEACFWILAEYAPIANGIVRPIAQGTNLVTALLLVFKAPKILFEYLNENKVTTICWVSAALSLCCQLNVFSEIKPEYVMEANQALNSVPKEGDSSCVNQSTGKQYTYKELKTILDNAKTARFIIGLFRGTA